jgi:hypothetical protein
MPNKTIYLSKELFEACKTINASEIISNLLKDYFNSKKSKEALQTEAEILQAEKLKLIQQKDKEISKIILEVKKVESEEEISKANDEKSAHKLANKISACIENTKSFFGIDITPEQAENFLKSDEENILAWLKTQ